MPCSAQARLDHCIAEIDEKLCKTALGCGIVTEDWTKRRIAERFGKALAQGFAGAGVVA